MNYSKLMLISVLSVMTLAACAKKETPAETQQDVAEAASEGAKDVAAEQRMRRQWLRMRRPR
jgi:ABC-type transporter MlaC component